MYEKYTRGVLDAMQLAFPAAAETGSRLIDSTHLLSAFVKSEKTNLGVYLPDISDAMKGTICRMLLIPEPGKALPVFRRGASLALINKRKPSVAVIGWTLECQSVVAGARKISQDRRHFPVIGTGHFLHSFLQEPQSVPARVLSAFGLTLESVHEKISRPLTANSPPPDTQARGAACG